MDRPPLRVRQVPGQQVPGQREPGQREPGQRAPGLRVPGQQAPGLRAWAQRASGPAGSRLQRQARSPGRRSWWPPRSPPVGPRRQALVARTLPVFAGGHIAGRLAAPEVPGCHTWDKGSECLGSWASSRSCSAPSSRIRAPGATVEEALFQLALSLRILPPVRALRTAAAKTPTDGRCAPERGRGTTPRRRSLPPMAPGGWLTSCRSQR